MLKTGFGVILDDLMCDLVIFLRLCYNVRRRVKFSQTKMKKSENQSNGPIILVENVSKVYPGEFVALQNINLSIEEGEFLSIVGASGAGKSTLLRLIYAEERPTAGEIFFAGRPLGKIRRKLLPFYRRNIGTVFQDFKLLSNRSVFENVAYALEVQGVRESEIEEEVPRILEIVGLEDKMEMYPYQLSGGEQQRVSLARALIHRPKIIVADEPTGNLDPASTWEIIKLLLKINDYGTTVILATHDREIVDKINKRVAVLESGRLVADRARGGYTV